MKHIDNYERFVKMQLKIQEKNLKVQRSGNKKIQINFRLYCNLEASF